jgi:DNA modification methylase
MTGTAYLDGRVTVHAGDCADVLKTLPDNSVDACVTDPPYHLTSIVKRFGSEKAAPAQYGTNGAYARASAGFMGKQWDGGDIAFRPELWAEVLRVLKPGGHLLAMGGGRTYHRMVCAIEDAGFEVRDQIMWVYGSGFPKSHDVSKAIDKAAGAEREVVGRTRKSIASMAPGEGNFSDDQYQWKAEFNRTAPATAAARAWQGWGTVAISTRW